MVTTNSSDSWASVLLLQVTCFVSFWDLGTTVTATGTESEWNGVEGNATNWNNKYAIVCRNPFSKLLYKPYQAIPSKTSW